MELYTHIKTCSENRLRVAELTKKLNLGPENVIARIAFAYSLSKSGKLNITDVKNSGGKEYTRRVLFGANAPYYEAMICTHYNLYKTDKDVAKYIKMHIDDGLELIDSELKTNPNLDGFDFLMQHIDTGLKNYL